MDREEALKLLRGGRDGVKEWNARRAKEEAIPSLQASDLSGADLGGVDLDGDHVRGADLREADLRQGNLSGADLSGADLSGANLLFTNLSYVNLGSTKLHWAWFGGTVIDADLSKCQGLDEVVHDGPSTISIPAILSFKDDLPEEFLRGCGLDDETIAYFRSRIGKPIRFYTCFISYSAQDDAFATRLHNDFQAAGIRCWKWDHNARTGRSLWGEIDQAIRQYDKLVLIASEHSLKSAAVHREIERALQQEDQRLKRKHAGEDVDPDVLFPVRIDDYVLDGWEHERKADVIKKVIGDARGWEKDNAKYQKVVQKLIGDLKPTP